MVWIINKVGCSFMTIKQKQWQLYYLAYYVGEIDGIWGKQSKGATKSFQADNGLTADGIFGAKTETKSVEIIRGIQEAVGAYADGLAGQNTVAATKEYQKEHGLVADGIAGPKTRAAIADDGDWWGEIKYFTPEEFACRCGGKYCNGYPVEIQKKLVQTADRVRAHFGAPATVSSGIRCEKHNANVGGVSNSRHKYGKAMDFCIRGKDAKKVLAYVQQQPEIRYAYAIDSNYVHMDIE